MKKNIKIIFAIALVIIIGVVVFIITSNTKSNVVVSKFEATSIKHLEIIQKSAKKYDLSITLPEDINSNSSDFELNLTRNDNFDKNNAIKLNYEKTNNVYNITNIEMESGDYYLWITEDGKQSASSITIPKMNPKIWMNGKIPNIEFEIDGETSWSSFIDPEGKSIYRSSKNIFDETATLIEENMDIIESSFTDSNPTDDEPYYYIQLVGKNGICKYISSPLFYHATQGNIKASFEVENDIPYLYLSGDIYAISKDEERSMKLRVGNYDSNNPAATFLVDNSYVGDDTTAFTFKIPVEELKDNINNLVLFLTENGTMLEWSLNAENLNVEDIYVTHKDIKYGLADNVALKVTKNELVFESINSELKFSSDKKTVLLNVSGNYKTGKIQNDTILVLKTADGETLTTKNESNIKDKFQFNIDLAQLNSPGIWYDVEIKEDESDRTFAIPFNSSYGEKKITTSSRDYYFRDYNGMLKVEYRKVRNFENMNIKLTNKDNKPTLVITGSTILASNKDAYLGIRTGDKVLEVANQATTKNNLYFEFDLRELSAADVWYDVLIGVHSDGWLYDLKSNMVGNMDEVLRYGDYKYLFADYEGDLKITYENSPDVFRNVSASIVDKGNIPTLIVKGDIIRDGLETEVYLGIRQGIDIIKVKNISTQKGKLLCEYDLSKLKSPGSWYDILLGITKYNSLQDIKKSNARGFNDTIINGIKTYGFKEYNEDLKVNFDYNLNVLSNISSTITEEKEKPILTVTGDVAIAGLDNEIYLALRTGETIIKVKNTSKSSKKLIFKYDLSNLNQKGVWYDLLIGISKYDALIDIPKTSAINFDTPLENLDREYAFKDFDSQLKITFGDKKAVKSEKASIIKREGKPILVITGITDRAAKEDLFLRIRSGAQTIDVQNSSLLKGMFVFEYDLTGLTEAGTWYDLVLGIKSEDKLTDLTTASVSDMNQTVENSLAVYSFKEWDGQLKINFDKQEIPGSGSILSTDTNLVDKEGVPTLEVLGTMEGYSNEDLFLRIRSDNQTLDIENASSKDGEFKFEYDLTGLTKAGTWYDLVLGIKSEDKLTDLTTASVSDMNQTVENSLAVYSFKEWSGFLKINFDTKEIPGPSSILSTDTNLVDKEGVPTLEVLGTMEGYSNDDLFLRIRSDDQTLDIENVSLEDGEFKFEYDLTGLTKAGTWYDLVLGIKSEDKLTDLTTASVSDMNQIVENSLAVYSFKEWSGFLKINFDTKEIPGPSSILSTNTNLVDKEGVPTLEVLGTMEGYSNDDLFLRIRSNDQTLDIQNTSSEDGEFKFEYDLTGLTEAGTWYDLVLGIKSEDKLTDLTTASVSDMNQTVENSLAVYSFKEWSGFLKINFDNK